MSSHSRVSAAAISLVFVCASAAAQQQKPQLAPADLVKAVIHNELYYPEGSQAKWKYMLDKEADGRQDTREVVETRFGSLARLISVAGTPLSDAQQREETNRILLLSNSREQQGKLEENRRK